MSGLFTTAGSTVHIGGAKAFAGTDFTASDFSSETWTQIKGVTNLGGVGDTSELVTSDHIESNRTRKGKGTRNAGAMELAIDLDYADAGQLAAIAAEKTKSSYGFKVTFNDAPAGGTPSERYFVAFVMSTREQFNEANSVMKLMVTLEVDSNVVRVAAAEA